jgi:hypothetical protein
MNGTTRYQLTVNKNNSVGLCFTTLVFVWYLFRYRMVRDGTVACEIRHTVAADYTTVQFPARKEDPLPQALERGRLDVQE